MLRHILIVIYERKQNKANSSARKGDSSSGKEGGENTSSSGDVLEEVLGQLECVSLKCREISWQEARKNYREVLKSLAEKYSTKQSVIHTLYHSEIDGFVGGDEHVLMLPSISHVEDFDEFSGSIFQDKSYEEKRIYKITHSECYGCNVFFDPFDNELTGRNFHARGNPDPWLYLKRWQLLNSISLYQTRFEGIVGAEPGHEDWPPRICISQPYVGGNSPTQAEITEALAEYGFEEVSLGSYYGVIDDILLTDAFPRNVRIWDSIPVLFDVIAVNPDEEVKQWLLGRI